jgi:hypothetical protein
MGADLIGWRECPLQMRLGPKGFLGKLKLRAYKELIESMVPPEDREGQKITVVINGPDGPQERNLTYPQIRDESTEFLRGIPDCSTCPLSGGKPLGCYHFVTYPIDPTFEHLVFDFFVSQVATKDSICDQLYRDIISRVPPQGTGWHDRRGEDARTGALAQLPQPLVHKWGGFLAKKRVDSAQILQSLFITLDRPALVVAYSRFWLELVEYAGKRRITDDDSPTLAAVRRFAPMMLATAASSVTDGWSLFADS